MKFAKKYMLVSADEYRKTPHQNGNGVARLPEFDPGELPDLREARQERSDTKDNLRDPNVSLYDKLARHFEHMTKYLAHMENLKKSLQEFLSAIRGLTATVPSHCVSQQAEDPTAPAQFPAKDAYSRCAPSVSTSVEKELGNLVKSMRTAGFKMGHDGSIRKGTFYVEPTMARRLLVAASTPARQNSGVSQGELRLFTAKLRKELVPYPRSAVGNRRVLQESREKK
jgi:hypothetical protein